MFQHQFNTKTKFKIIFLGLLAIGGIFFTIIWHLWEVPLISPITDNSLFEFISTEEILPDHLPKNKIVYGFLPYWSLNRVNIQPELTHLSYFGLNIDQNGNITTENDEGQIHPGYKGLNSDQLTKLAQEINQNHNYFEITLVQFENETIKKIANNPEAHQNLITTLDSILLAYPISGVNIDIEYSGEVDEELRHNFATLVETIRHHLDQKYGNIQLSIDMYASASDNKQLWDVPRIARSVDYIIVMAYDFHRRSSMRAGPVAPLFHDQNQANDDIHKNLRNFLRYVPKEKILLGIPFYGYEWQVDQRSPYANTYPDTGATASYERVKSILQNPSLQVETGWDDRALCPYLIYEKDDKIQLIYYENPTSIKYKLEYVRQLDLAGIAIWALGYEGESRDLWQSIRI